MDSISSISINLFQSACIVPFGIMTNTKFSGEKWELVNDTCT